MDPQAKADWQDAHIAWGQTAPHHMTIRKSITIRELPAGWLAKERGTTYKTAHAALQATRREYRAIARGIPSAAVVGVITWEPTTSAGRAVVTALQP